MIDRFITRAICVLPFFAALSIWVSVSLALEAPSPDQAVAYINPTRSTEHIAHPYPMFYDYHVAPHAVKQSGKIFFAYQDEHGRSLAMAYDIASNNWDGPHRVSTSGLDADSHGNPSICLDAEGRVHVFFGAHNGPLGHAVSREPLRVDAWDEVAPAAPHATYPQSQRLPDGALALFFRSGKHPMPWVITTSSDQGHSWSKPINIVEMRRDPKDAKAAAYCTMFPGTRGRSLHCFFIHKDDNAARVFPHPWRPLKYPGLNEAVYRYNLYYVRRNQNGKWTNLAGEQIDLPISKRMADDKLLVFDSADEFTRCTALAADSEDRPYARFNVGVVDLDREIVPWRTHFAAPSKDNPDKWKIAEGSTELPKDIQTRLVPEVLPVYDGDNGGLSTEWFVHHEIGNFKQGTGSRLYLGHFVRGWITRNGGPAPPPDL